MTQLMEAKMESKILMLMTLLALFFFASPPVGRAQKDGEAQSVSFDENNWATLKFSDRRSGNSVCETLNLVSRRIQNRER